MAREVPPKFWTGDRRDEHLRKVTEAVRGLMAGRSNAVYRATLSASPATTTVVTVNDATPDQIANLTPLSSAAAAEAGTTYAVVGDGIVTIHHAAGGSDREFGFILQG